MKQSDSCLCVLLGERAVNFLCGRGLFFSSRSNRLQLSKKKRLCFIYKITRTGFLDACNRLLLERRVLIGIETGCVQTLSF
jgi:hypothetical protein